jgi:hypothetical protein
MLRKTFYTAISITLFFVVFFLLNFFHIKPSDFKEYERMQQKKNKLSNNNSIKNHRSHQYRQNVQKDIYIVDDDQRMHFRIFSSNTNLFLNQKEKIHIIETLNDLQCWMEDNSQKEIQHKQVKYFQAKTGSYTYPTHQFIANQVDMQFFLLKKDEKISSSINPKNSYLQGYANEVNFILSEKKPNFHAIGFQASFNPIKVDQ